MHLAAELAKIDVVEMLLKAGLDLTIQDRVRNFFLKFCTSKITPTQQHNTINVSTLLH